MARVLALIALLAAGAVDAFQAPARSLAVHQAPRRSRFVLFDTDEDFGAPEVMTGKGRLGSSIDQDGKSNIWAVEPKMKVDEEGGGGGAAVAVGIGAVLALGLIIGAFAFIQVEQ